MKHALPFDFYWWIDWLIAVLRYGHWELYYGPLWILGSDLLINCGPVGHEREACSSLWLLLMGLIDWLRFLDMDTESSIAALLDSSVKQVPHLTFTDGLIGWLIAAFLRYGHGELYCSLVGHECETRAPLWLGGGAYRLLLPQHGHQPGPLRRSQGQPWVPVPVLQAGLLEPLLFDSGQIPAPVPTPTPTSTLKHVIFI